MGPIGLCGTDENQQTVQRLHQVVHVRAGVWRGSVDHAATGGPAQRPIQTCHGWRGFGRLMLGLGGGRPIPKLPTWSCRKKRNDLLLRIQEVDSFMQTLDPGWRHDGYFSFLRSRRTGRPHRSKLINSHYIYSRTQNEEDGHTSVWPVALIL